MKVACLIVYCMVWALPVEASVLDTFGFGPRAMAMGNAHTALSQDTSANYYNPAGLTGSGEVTISAGYLRTSTSLRINEKDLGLDEVHGSMIGLCVPGDFGDWRGAMGLAFYMPDARVSRVRALPETQPRFVLFDNRGQHVEIRANIAIEPFKGFSIGGGLAFLTSTRGTVLIEGNLTENPEEAALETGVDVTFETSRFPVAGIRWEIDPDWVLGLAYRGKSLVELDIAADVQAQITGLLGAQALDGQLQVASFNTNFFSPHQVFLGAGWDTPWNSLLTVDVGWLHWSGFPTPTARVNIDVEIPNLPTDTLIPEPSVPEEPGFHDIIVIRSGLEHPIFKSSKTSLAARLGYGFEPTPAPEQTERLNLIDSSKHLLTLGTGFGIFEHPDQGEHPLQIDLAGQWLILADREHQKVNPADPVGDMRANGNIWTLGIQLTGRFPW